MTQLLNLSAKIWYERSRALNALEKYREALNSIDKAINIALENNKDLDSFQEHRINLLNKYLNLKDEEAKEFEKAEKWEEAIHVLSEALELEISKPHLPHWLTRRGIAYLESGDCSKSLTDLNEAIELTEDDDFVAIKAYRVRSTVKDKLKQFEAAIQDLNKVLEFDPNYSNGYIFRASLLERLGDFQTAILNYDQGIKLSSDLEEICSARSLKGSLLQRMGNAQAAVEEYTQCIEIEPKEDRLYSQRASAYLDLGDFQSALSNLTQAIQIKPNFYMYYFLRSHLLHEYLKSYELAIQDHSKCLALSPPPSYQVYVFMQRGLALYILQRHQEALPDLDKAIQLSKSDDLPNDFDKSSLVSAYLARGHIYKDLNNFNQMINDASEALQLNLNDSFSIDAYMLQAKAYLALKNYNQAIQNSRKLIDIYENSNDPSIGKLKSVHTAYANAYSIIAISSAELGRVSDAIETADKSLQIYEFLGDDEGVKRNLVLLNYLSNTI